MGKRVFEQTDSNNKASGTYSQRLVRVKFSWEKQKYGSKGMFITTHKQNIKYTKWKTILRREASEISEFNTESAPPNTVFFNVLRILYFQKGFQHTKRATMVNYMDLYLSTKIIRLAAKQAQNTLCQQILDLKFKERRNRLKDGC